MGTTESITKRRRLTRTERDTLQDTTSQSPLEALGRRTRHGFSSCTKTVEVLQDQFLGRAGGRTLFQIELTQGQGRDVSDFSLFDEGEVLLPPGSRFEVTAVLDQGELAIIFMKEMHSEAWIIDLSQPAARRARTARASQEADQVASREARPRSAPCRKDT